MACAIFTPFGYIPVLGYRRNQEATPISAPGSRPLSVSSQSLIRFILVILSIRSLDARDEFEFSIGGILAGGSEALTSPKIRLNDRACSVVRHEKVKSSSFINGNWSEIIRFGIVNDLEFLRAKNPVRRFAACCELSDCTLAALDNRICHIFHEPACIFKVLNNCLAHEA